MADDYAPVPYNEDEEQLKQYGGYAPVIAPSAPAPAAPAITSAYPAVGSTADLESRAARPKEFTQDQQLAVTPAPQWKDYAPAQPHGFFSKLGHTLAARSPWLNYAINQRPEEQAEKNYTTAVQEYERPAAEKAKAAETEQKEAQAGQEREQVKNLQSEERAREHPPVKPATNAFELWAQQNPDTPAGEYLKLTQEAKPAQKPDTPEEQFFDSPEEQGKTQTQKLQDYARITQKPEQPPKPQQVLGEDKDGNVFEIKPGMKLPEGAQPLTGAIKQAQGEESKVNALQFAEDYATSGAYTGPEDETLMEKYFEIAKPSSGFRMSQPQIDMLMRAQSWKNSLEARYRHATTGVWFSTEQRNEIVKAMRDVQQAKQHVKGGGGQGGGNTQHFTEGGKHWDIPREHVEDFKKDHPNAR